ncbi:mitochondrial carrier domain-containing protein [Jimgerdemannia flammicorona]|uniref:Mitochondrial carrier domain-containing protein n=2 Tax=Jimgerdemannia flammicorona TaxID=994334 RepID=A0A433R0H6_9FUNG|nr:mitochondrial carrier domain-containing protein [Jimgerdemannia flammicorona]RUS35465.1 mitochondrial carrier domain-containing protein [Jimgerdemannia flammicorona]
MSAPKGQKKNITNHTLAGAGAGIVEVLVMQPADVLKTRFQSVRVANHYRDGIFNATTRILRSEGVMALYRGTWPVIWIVMPRVSLQYMGLATFKPIFERVEGTLIPLRSSAALAGACTGIVQAVTLVTPLEMIKVRQQTDLISSGAERKYHGMLSTIRSVVSEEGVFALYKGLVPTVVRQSWGLVVKFTGYTEIKGLFERTASDPSAPLAPWKHMASGGLANVLVGVFNSPPDVVKTRMQDRGANYQSSWDCCRRMLRNEGLMSFFRGAWLRVLRVAPGGAIQFAVYEQFAAMLDKRSAKLEARA